MFCTDLEDKFMNDEIMVSICCLVFNHEKYLRKCLDGFVNQKTNFKFEVLIHDDASTDKSPEIIKEYEKKYPDIIKPIYQKENQYSQGKKISIQYQFPRAKGKYIAFCEGDDYWTDNQKLQMQYDIMEKYIECSVCVHNVIKMNEDGTCINEKFPPLKYQEGIIENNVFIKNELVDTGWIFQTSSFFFRNAVIQQLCEEMPEFVMKSTVGDLPYMLFAITKGKIYYMDRDMSNYRMASCSSVTKTNADNRKQQEKYLKGQIQSLEAYDRYTEKKYHAYIQKYVMKLKSLYLFCTEQYIQIIQNKEYFKYLNKINIIQCYIMKYAPHTGKFIVGMKRKLFSILNK